MNANLCINFSVIDKKFPDHQFKSLLMQLPPGMQYNILKFRNWQDAQASLTGKLLLQNLLQKFSPGSTLFDIIYNPYGRPIFKNLELDLSISHSGRYVVCAFGIDLRLGIDIEIIKSIDPHEFARYFQSDEMNTIAGSQNPLFEFYNLWTKKEALIKALGKGLSFPLNDVRIKNDEALLEEQTWYLQEIKISAEYCCHLATSCKINDPIEVCEVFVGDKI
jgi:4'-phosphopantetheinyl transferase